MEFLRVRPDTEAWDFCYAQWRNNAVNRRGIDAETVRMRQRIGPIIIDTMNRAETWVARLDPELDEEYSGFICAEPAEEKLHYLYVKYPLRGAGIAREMFLHAFGTYKPVICCWPSHNPTWMSWSHRRRDVYRPVLELKQVREDAKHYTNHDVSYRRGTVRD